MPVTPTALGDVLVAGDDYVVTITVTKDGATYDITGATLTCTIRAKGKSTNLTGLTDHAMTITTAASGIATLTLLDTETANLDVGAAGDYLGLFEHVGDVTVVESGGDIFHTAPFSFNARRKVT